jgi:hypothetical protein
MKLFKTVVIAGVALSLAACAATSGNQQKVRVKCPQCGYEFMAPTE